MTDGRNKLLKNLNQKFVIVAGSLLLISLTGFLVGQDLALRQVTAASVLTWVVCWLLFALVDLLAGGIERGLWAGYLYLTITVAWLTVGVPAALLVLFAGAATSGLVRLAKIRLPDIPIVPIQPVTPIELTFARITLSGTALVGTVATYTLVGGSLPFSSDIAGLARLSFVLLVGLFISQVMGVLLKNASNVTTPLGTTYFPWRQRIGGELLLLVLIIPTAHVHSQAGVPVFSVLMGLLAAQAIRFQKTEIVQQALHYQVQELSLLTSTGRNISTNLVIGEVVPGIYEWVRDLMKISQFYIALCDDQGEIVEFPLIMQHDNPISRPNQRIVDDPAITRVLQTKAVLQLVRGTDQALNKVFDSLPDDEQHQVYLGLPLTTATDVLVGVMGIIGDDRFLSASTAESQMLQAIAHQAGLALGNAMLYDQSTRLVDNLNLINRSMRDVVFNMDDEAAIQVACTMALSIANAQKVAIFVAGRNEGDAMALLKSVGMTPTHHLSYSDPVYQPAGQMGKLRVIADVSALAEDDVVVELSRVGGFKAMAEIPLKSGDALTGVLTIFHNQPHHYAKTELELLETLAYQVAAALDNAALLDALELYASEQAQLVQLSRISTASLDIQTVINSVTDVLPSMIAVDQIFIGLLMADQDQMQVYKEDGSTYRAFYVDDVPEVAALLQQARPSLRIYNRDEGVVSESLLGLTGDWPAIMALVPLIADKELLGMILLANMEPREFPENEWRRVEMAANQMAAQFHNVQLHTTTQKALNRRLQQLGLIEEIAQQISSALDLDQIISNVMNAAIQSTQADVAALGLKSDGGALTIRVVEYLNGEWKSHRTVREPDLGVMGRVLRTGKTFLIPDNRTVPDYLDDLAQETYLSSLVVPLVQDDEVLGVLNVESKNLNYFNQENAAFLKSLAGHAVISLQNAWLLQQHQAQIETLIWLRDLSLQLSSETDQQSVVAVVLQTALRIMQGQDAVLFGCHADAAGLALRRLGGLSNDAGIYTPSQVFVPDPIVFEAVRTGEIQVIEDVRHSAYFQAQIDRDGLEYASLIVAPVRHGNQVEEVLCVTGEKPQHYDDADINTMELLASQAAGHLENVQLYENIHAASTRMRAIIDSTREGIILLDPEGRLIEANATAEHLLNIDMEDHVGQNFVEFLITHLSAYSDEEQDALTHESLIDMARILRLEPERITRRSLEIRKEGKPRYIEEVGSPVTNSRGQILGRLLTLRDITEERLLEAYRNEISSMVVHDLRGPLGNIISSHIVMQEIVAELGDPALPPLLEVSLDSATGLMNLVDSLLDIAKLETRRMPLKRSVLSVQDLVESAYQVLATSVANAKITVERDIPEDLPDLNVDGDKIRRVIINVLDNAVRYSPLGGKVRISAEQKDAKVVVRIADSGPGIPPEERERIFEKFRQVKMNIPQRGSKGTGLGLTFCKLAIEAHHENIWVDQSQVLPGASFNFTLPIAN